MGGIWGNVLNVFTFWTRLSKMRRSLPVGGPSIKYGPVAGSQLALLGGNTVEIAQTTPENTSDPDWATHF